MFDHSSYQAARREMAANFGLTHDFISWADKATGLTITNTDGGGITINDIHGGTASVQPSDATVGDNDESYVHTEGKVFTVAADKFIYAACRYRLDEANVDDGNVIFGFSSAAIANTLQDDGAGPPATYDGAVFFKVDGGTVWQVESSNAGDQTTKTDGPAFADDTYVVQEVLIHPNDGVTAHVYFIQDGTLVVRQNLTVSGLEAMFLVLGVKNGGANEEELEVDWVLAKATR